MNGKKARYLRKLAQLNSEKNKFENRQYVSFESAVKKKAGAILDPSKPKGEQLTFSEWDQPCRQIERIDGSYKVYKFLKKRSKKFDHEMPYYNADVVDTLVKKMEASATRELQEITENKSSNQEVIDEQDNTTNEKHEHSVGREEDLHGSTGGGVQSGDDSV